MSSSIAPGEVRAGAGVQRRQWTRLASAIAAVALLQLAVHYAALADATDPVMTLAPLGLPALLALWHGARHGRVAALITATGLVGVAALALSSPEVARILPLACQLGVCLALAWLFGSTLRPGVQPLVTRMARAVHGDLPPPIEAYTRNVTIAWTLFLLALAGASAVLYLLVPMRTWSTFANLLLLPLIAAMFLGAPAGFPASPFRIAALLRRPLVLMVGLYRGGNRYELHFERLVEQGEIASRDRAAAIERWVRRYAQRLEHYCRGAPYNWFNFYDFWDAGESGR